MDAYLLLTSPIAERHLLDAVGRIDGIGLGITPIDDRYSTDFLDEFPLPAKVQVWLYDESSQDEELWGRGIRTAVERLASIFPGDLAVGLDVGQCLLTRINGEETLYGDAWYKVHLAGASIRAPIAV